jgi:hypothetical protein
MKQLAGACSVSLVLTAAAWAQTPAGGEFRVNTYITGRQLAARPAMEPDGAFVIVWSSYQDGSYGSGYGAFGQRFAASGAPRGSEFRINTYTTGFQALPAAAVGTKGDFIVVWESAPDVSTMSIQGKRYDASGNAIGAEFMVSTFTTSIRNWPHVGRASDGRYVVAWTDWYLEGSTEIVARRFDASGHAVGSEFVVNSCTQGDQLFGDVAVAANGDFVVVWESSCYLDGSDSAISGQRYDAVGNRLGGEFLVNTTTTGRQLVPSVSVSPAGGFVVAWTGYREGALPGMFLRRFDASGSPVGNDFIVSTYTTGQQFGFFGQVAHDAHGNFIVTWEGRGDGNSYGISAQRFDPSGARRGAEFQVNTYTTGRQTQPSIACDLVGNFVVAWHSRDQDGSDYGIFAQRFGGLGPAALTVDSSGNQVLEPGETVDVRPTWRNLNGAAQTFGGTLTTMTGPVGATYTIIDSAADYGTVADGVTGQCSDCYTARVSNPNPRPAAHWDASVVESILPDTQGQQKQWRLHVGLSFSDVATASPFYPFIETLLHFGVTGGCGGTNYCPSTTTTRDQMSVFVLVAKEGPGYTPPACGTPVFTDVPASNPFCRFIEELARRGVVGGCGGNNYCPTSPVTRDAMSVFALRTLDSTLNPPACVAGSEMFLDVPSTNGFCRWIEELARRGVVSGCGNGNYCPASAVTREQMGVFISATFGLTLYGP